MEEYLKECFIVSIVLHYYLDTNFQFLFNYCQYYLSKIIFTECLFSHRNFKFKAKFTKPNKSLPIVNKLFMEHLGTSTTNWSSCFVSFFFRKSVNWKRKEKQLFSKSVAIRWFLIQRRVIANLIWYIFFRIKFEFQNY